MEPGAVLVARIMFWLERKQSPARDIRKGKNKIERWLARGDAEIMYALLHHLLAFRIWNPRKRSDN